MLSAGSYLNTKAQSITLTLDRGKKLRIARKMKIRVGVNSSEVVIMVLHKQFLPQVVMKLTLINLIPSESQSRVAKLRSDDN